MEGEKKNVANPSRSCPRSQLQQAVEEKGAVAAQLLAVSQTLRDTQNRCHWLEMQGRAQVKVLDKSM